MKYVKHPNHLEMIPETAAERKLIKEWWPGTGFHLRPSVEFTVDAIKKCWSRTLPDWLQLHNWKDL